jgi:hypothetical protein
MKDLLEKMIRPDPLYRIDAGDANRHKALMDDEPMNMSTPPFVRTAASLPIEPRGKKQVPREKREQKRSQALQAETGAKFLETNRIAEPMPVQAKAKNECKTSAEKVQTPVLETIGSVSRGEGAKVDVDISTKQLEENQEVDVIPTAIATSPKVDNERAPSRIVPVSRSPLASGAHAGALSERPSANVAGKSQGHKAPQGTDSASKLAVSPSFPQRVQSQELRRPASSAALRDESTPIYQRHNLGGAVPEESHRPLALDRQASLNDGYYVRHARFASEGAMRALDRQTDHEDPERARPKSQLSFVHVRKFDEDRDGVRRKSYSIPSSFGLLTLMSSRESTTI